MHTVFGQWRSATGEWPTKFAVRSSLTIPVNRCAVDFCEQREVSAAGSHHDEARLGRFRAPDDLLDDRAPSGRGLWCSRRIQKESKSGGVHPTHASGADRLLGRSSMGA